MSDRYSLVVDNGLAEKRIPDYFLYRSMKFGGKVARTYPKKTAYTAQLSGFGQPLFWAPRGSLGVANKPKIKISLILCAEASDLV